MSGTYCCRWLGTIATLAVVVVGCGPPGVGATAEGVVTIDGKTAPSGIRVDFQPQGPAGSPSMGVTDANGRYKLFFTPARKGVMPGECRVMLQPSREYGPDGTPQIPEALKSLRLPWDYAGEQSPLIRTVKPGWNQIDIAIDTTSTPNSPK
jgi:hypothetical protein